MMKRFEVGDPVVYHKTKTSTHPGPRAEGIRPAAHGDNYSYTVDKCWTVSAVLDDNMLELKTRTGKMHELRTDDPNLRKAGLLERILLRDRFPDIEQPAENADHERS
jgi:hypothetical protein